jgi:hypothetical protein
MSHRCLAAVLTVLAVVSMAPVPAAAQSAVTSTPLRTPWGDLDLQGRWTNDTFTPLQRPAHLAGKEFFTEEEAAELTRLLTADGVDPLAGNVLNEQNEERRRERVRQSKENIHYDNAIWLTATRPKGLTSRRTSLIVDPPDGRIPPMRPEAQKREADRAAAMKGRVFDGPDTRPLSERCIIWPHEGPPLIPPVYNNIYQIFQTPGYVVIHQEMTHNARIIPLDGRPHISPNIRQWSGDSRGRWEGQTLVVETTNLTDRTRFQGSTEALHVIERFTRVDAETVRYEFTVEDPKTWTRPWTAEIPMMRTEDFIYEYACHEGNYDLANILRAARTLEQAAEDAAKKGSR